MKRAVLVVLLFFLAGFYGLSPISAASAVHPAAQQNVPRIEWGECMFEIPAGLTLSDVDCGWLIVPESYEDPQGPTIRLGVAVIRSTSENPASEPLVMLQGGPGGSTIDTYAQAIALVVPHLRSYSDIVLFDQRGTLYSEPNLLCPEETELMIEYLDRELTDEEETRLSMEAVQACRQRLISEGVNLSAFNSVQNAHDVDSLREALGHEQINLYGVSYGTLLAQHVMRQHPEGLRAVVLDAVVPTNLNFITGAPQTMNRSFEALFEACRQNADCNASYPNLEEVFYQQVDRLNEDPVMIILDDAETGESYPALLDGEAFKQGIFQMMYATELIPFMPRVIYDARINNFDFFSTIYALLIFDRSMSSGMYYSVICAEDADFSPEDVQVEGLREDFAESEREDAEAFLEICNLWDVDTLDASVDEAVVSDIPTLLFSGSFDPITPPAYAELAAESLTNDYSVEIPWGGHAAIASSDCADQIMLDFLRNPSKQPDASCVDEHAGIEFITAGSLVRLPVIRDLANLQNGTGPQLLIYMVGLLFLLSALLVYPIVWLVRKLRKSDEPKAPTSVETAPLPSGQEVISGNPFDADQYRAPVPSEPPARVSRPRGLYHLAPWLAVFTGLALLVFTVLLIGIIFNLALTFDYRILMGLPGSSRPMFVLPLLAVVLLVLMVVVMFAAWVRGAGSVWGRLYFSLLTLSTMACVVVLGMWGMLTGLFA